MATGYRLLDQPNPNYPQYGYPRRNGRTPTGGIILHDAEGGTDLSGADTGAENVARYISTRTTPGSYHILTDRDSTIAMAPFEYEVWHDTTSNNYTVGISVAWNKADLPRMTRAQRDEFYRPFARAVLSAVAWFKARGIHVPTDRFLSRDEIVAGKPGLSTHSRMDPGRRSDPFGTGSIYEAEFLDVLAAMATAVSAATVTPPATPNPSEEDDVLIFKSTARNSYFLAGASDRPGYILEPATLNALKDAGVKVVEVDPETLVNLGVPRSMADAVAPAKEA